MGLCVKGSAQKWRLQCGSRAAGKSRFRGIFQLSLDRSTGRDGGSPGLHTYRGRHQVIRRQCLDINTAGYAGKITVIFLQYLVTQVAPAPSFVVFVAIPVSYIFSLFPTELSSFAYAQSVANARGDYRDTAQYSPTVR